MIDSQPNEVTCIYNPNTQRFEPTLPLGQVSTDWQPVERQLMRLGASLPFDQIDSYEREFPSRKPDYDADVFIPLMQASLTGLLSWPFLTVVVYQFGARLEFSIGLAFCVALLVWFNGLANSRRLLRVVERVTGFDIDGDGYIGEPETEQDNDRRDFRVAVEVDPTHQQIRYFDLPQPIENKLPAIANAVLVDGAAFSRPELATRRKLLTQGQYEELKATLLDAGFVRSETGNRTEITSAGRAFFRHYLE